MGGPETPVGTQGKEVLCPGNKLHSPGIGLSQNILEDEKSVFELYQYVFLNVLVMNIFCKIE